MANVFVHGLGQSPSSWEATISKLGLADTAACPNLAKLLDGQETAYTSLYQAFSKYCEQFSDPLDLCGLSLGGVLALNYAIDHPDRVGSLVLIGAQYKASKGMTKFQRTVFRLLPEMSFQNSGFSKEQFIQLNDSMLGVDFSRKLAQVRASSLILYGVKDSPNRKSAKELAKYIPGAKIQVIEGSHHEINEENPMGLATALKEFYQSLS